MICAGGGGIPTMYGEDGKLRGIEAVIDKDLCSSLLATQLEADLLVIATDVNAAFIDFGKPTQKAIGQAHPDDMEKLGFAAGSMGPKVQAACEFARQTGKTAVIGSLGHRSHRPGQRRHAHQHGKTWHHLPVKLRRNAYGYL